MKTTADFYATIMLLCILIVLTLLALYVNWMKTAEHKPRRIKRGLRAQLGDFWHYWKVCGMSAKDAWERALRVLR
jgi:hypothetical protein